VDEIKQEKKASAMKKVGFVPLGSSRSELLVPLRYA
jgi:hypothetical protein